MFGKWDKFKYVPKQLQIANDLQPNLSYNDFQIIETNADLVEVLYYFNK